MSDEDIKELIKEFPKAFDLVRGVYLWGCYTTTKEGISFWKKNVPSAYAINTPWYSRVLRSIGF